MYNTQTYSQLTIRMWIIIVGEQHDSFESQLLGTEYIKQQHFRSQVPADNFQRSITVDVVLIVIAHTLLRQMNITNNSLKQRPVATFFSFHYLQCTKSKFTRS
jgi:hypothetical protein